MDQNGRVSPVVGSSLAATAVAINLSIGVLVQVLRLPLYLDQVGTVFIGFAWGAVPGAGVGVATMLAMGILINPTSAYYLSTAALVGVVAGFAGRRLWFRSIPLTLLAGIAAAGIAAVASAPVTVLAFGGITGVGSDLLVGFFRATGRTLWESVILTGGVSELVDKPLVFLLAAGIVRLLPKRVAAAFPRLGEE